MLLQCFIPRVCQISPPDHLIDDRKAPPENQEGRFFLEQNAWKGPMRRRCGLFSGDATLGGGHLGFGEGCGGHQPDAVYKQAIVSHPQCDEMLAFIE